jgi:hypothetical protein
MTRHLLRFAIASGAVTWTAAVLAVAPQRTLPSRGLIDFDRQVQPIIAKHCLECHSQDKRKGGLSLATYADALDGGRNGPAIRPGNSTKSLLLHRITGVVEPQMPKDEDPLTPAEIALVRRWIDQGARATSASAPAPQPWEAPLTLAAPAIPTARWAGWTSPLDRLVVSYLAAHKVPRTDPVSDQLFARRAYLDVWGLLPTPEQLQEFVADSGTDKRARLVTRLLADEEKYADHWMSFWNDVLRNEDGVNYFSETAGRKSITDWLYPALRRNVPYDEFVSKLLNPTLASDPEGFLVGVNWRGETSAAVTPWMQAAQNSAQVFLGINLKCNACHDSFVSKWKLKDAYALAAYFAPEPTLQLYRCDVALNQHAEPGFLFPELTRAPASDTLGDRRAAAAATFLDPRMGRLPRTLVNRIWHRLLGRGLVANPDEMDGVPWSPEVLDWLASDFVEHRYDIKHVISTIMLSRAYEMPAVPRTGEPPTRGYIFAGPEVRRLTSEQFADAIGAMTGEWNTHPARPPASSAVAVAPARTGPPPSMASTSGLYGREWRVASSSLTRALGRPIRDQITSTRAAHASTLQALELVNGELLTHRLSRGARRLVGELPPEPLSLYNRTVAGRNASPTAFEIDVTGASRLWLVVQDNGSNVPEVLEPAWADAEFVGPSGTVPLAAIEPLDRTGVRSGSGPVRVATSNGTGLRVRNPSVVVYDIAGRGVTTFRGVIGLENAQAEIGSTLNPQLRFFVFNAAPNMERLLPPLPGTPLPSPTELRTVADAAERVFRYALGRSPTSAEQEAAESALRDPSGSTRPFAPGLADLLWAVTMKPEFQLIY